MKINAVFGAATAGKSYFVTRQRRLNCYYSNRRDKDKTAIAVYGTPGMQAALTMGQSTTPVRALLGSADGTLLYGANANKFLVVTPSGSQVFSATLATNAGLLSMAQNPGGTQIALVDGSLGYVYTGGALAVISSSWFPTGARTIVNVSGFFVAEKPGTQQFFVSNLGDATSGSGLAVGSASAYPDILLAVDSLLGNLVLLSTTHTEFWQNVGASPNPFAPILSAVSEWGLAAIFSRCHVDNSLCFLGRSQQGGYSVMRIQGFNVTKISDDDLDAILNDPAFGRVDDATALTYRDSEHAFYQLTFPTANRSFLYDTSTGIWGETQTGLTSAYAQRHTGNISTLFNGQSYIADYKTNQLYIPNPKKYTDNGVTIPRRIITKHQVMDFNVYSIGEAYVDFEVGVGLVSGQGVNPFAQLSISKNNGMEWLTPRVASIGAMGNYTTRVIWRRLGAARCFDFDLLVTDPVKFALTTAASSAISRPQR